MAPDPALLEKSFELLVAAAQGNAKALLALAEKARKTGDMARCVALVEDALAASPDDPEIASMAHTMRARTVPGRYFLAIRDDARNLAFQGAIERAVAPGMKVLDVGAGAGLLSMMAARAGAGVAHACEANPAIAGAAHEIISLNGFSDTIAIHMCSARHLDPQADLGGQADLVVSGIFGKDLVRGEVLSTMRDAVGRLARPGAQCIPQGGEIRIALAHLAELEARRAGDACGFDLSLFNRRLPTELNVRADHPGLTLRGEPLSVLEVDFAATGIPDQLQAELVATGGAVNGVVQWSRLRMDAVDNFENAPGPGGSSAWVLGFYPFEAQRVCNAGDRIAVSARVDDNRLRIWEA